MGYKTDWFRGIYPALVTPFTRDDRLDEEAYRRLIRHVLPHVNGVVPCGTTGEFSYMTIEERQRAIEVCLDEVNGRVPVLAGTGCPSTRETLELTRWARDAGVTGVLVVAPYYLKPNFNEVYDHFRALDKLGVPIVIYNIPQCAGTHFRWWTAEG
ncbi:MAG: dihydrodipicolinate synthase family protein, partial [Anaerolineae bacterium]|nr:dihydrodipicolinate synthase family protein [Anaerolineae bacterium]